MTNYECSHCGNILQKDWEGVDYAWYCPACQEEELKKEEKELAKNKEVYCDD